MRDIFITNSLGNTLQPFKPIEHGKVRMYHCGPTVYDTAHIGNFRTFITNDIIRRTFEYLDYKVLQAMNITDIDDKTINRSKEENTSLSDLTNKYSYLFFQDCNRLNILTPHIVMKATDYIPHMQEMILTLVDKGIAYKTSDGIYLSIGLVKNYGILAGLKSVFGKEAVSRIAKDEYEKENPQDFALWKFETPEDAGNSWNAPFGRGRPGWHIECSAMALSALGSTIDIHTGGSDLIFPHHTNEIAQSECATGKKFVNYWIHSGFLTVNDTKMSKSKGNHIKITDLIEQSISPISFRYAILTAHYRTQINIGQESLMASQSALTKLITFLAETRQNDRGKPSSQYTDLAKEYIAHDFNTPKVIALLWDIVKNADMNAADKVATIFDIDRILGLNLEVISRISIQNDIPPEIQALAEARNEAREAKEWDKADALRQEIRNRGYDVVDTEKGFNIHSL